MKKNVLIFTVVITSFLSSFAQNDFKYKTDVIPPSPDAAALGSYGGLSPNLINGAASASIPLYSLKVGNREVGLALSYSSTGFKVDELCTSVGYGWSLQGGGVISRVIYDIPDELGQKVCPPDNISLNRPQFNTFLQMARSDVDYEKNTDGQPDQFSFNFMGYSGKFILDRFMHPVLIEHANLKIEFSASLYIDDFKITTPDGAEFFFAEIETTRSGSSCGTHNNILKPTSWFLSRAKFSNGEEVFFTYKGLFIHYNMGISQTVYSNQSSVNGCPGEQCPSLSNTICTNYFDHSTLLLTKISCSSGSLDLTYTDRLDALTGAGLQTKGELLSTVTLNNPDGVKLKSFFLEYQNVNCGGTRTEERSRPFLVKLSEKDKQDVTIKHHGFEYNDLAGLPPRLSYSQDHWGYFNGKSNNTLMPKPSSFSQQSYYPLATANREPDENYAKKGLLRKIAYPTGGVEEMNYEANTIYINKRIMADLTNHSTYAQGTALKTRVIQTNTIDIGVSQQIRLMVTVSELDPVDPYFEYYDPEHNIAIVTVLKGSSVLYSKNRGAGTFDVVTMDVLAGDQITIKVESYGQLIKANALIQYIPGVATWTYVNDKVGGVRVSSTTISASANDQPLRKFFYYAKLSTLNQSSGSANYTPTYNRSVITRLTCNVSGSYYDCSKDAMYSNAIYNLFTYPSGIQYQYLTESIGGPNFENGGIQHSYTLVADSRPYPILGKDIGGVPYENYSIYSGKEIETYIFNKERKPVQTTVIEYTDDIAAKKDINAYTVTLKCALPVLTKPWPDDDEIESYNYSNNKILSRWIYKSRETIYKYDLSGKIFLADQTDYSYDNPAHALMTSTTHYNSKGGKNIQNIGYVSDQAVIAAKTPYQARLDFEQAIATCDNIYNQELNALNTQIVSLVGQAHQIWMDCYNQWINNCNGAACIDCQSTTCAGYNNDKMEECRINNGYYTIESQKNTLIQNSTIESDHTDCINAVIAQYNSDINNYNTALSQAIAGATDEYTKAVLVMQQNNISNAVASSVQFKDNLATELSRTENKYKYWPNELVNPQYVFQSVNGNTPENTMSFLQYDAKGNVLDYQKTNDVVNSLIWDYQNNYPVAKCTGASFNDIAYTSFESDGTGNWTKAGTVLTNGGVTGNNSFNGSVSKNFNTTGDYLVGVWCSTSAIVTINGAAGTTVATKGNWKLIQAKILNTNSIQVSGSNFDEVRVHPVGAQMVTYTYERLVGITTQSDPNNKISFYEYDSYGRLRLIKDNDGSILKTFDYHYQQAN